MPDKRADERLTDADTRVDREATRERAFLAVYHGEHTEVIELEDGCVITFGRGAQAGIAIEHARVSRNHARVIRRGAAIVVEDLGSRNGTWVNGARIDSPTRLASGDEIAVGLVKAVLGQSTPMRLSTVVGSASVLDERLAAETDRAHRYHRPLGLIMIRLEGPPAAVDATLDRLGSVLRRMDCLAEYGPNEFAVILPEADEEATRAAARRLTQESRVASLPHGAVQVRAGIAAFPGDGTTPGELVGRARAALRAARAGGGDKGVAAAPAGAEATQEHVVLDPQMKRVFTLVDRVAEAPITVLIQGETGVGKGMVAQEIHRRSGRRALPFVKLNCAAIPETLLESELFGYERGAFTGADKRKPGFFEASQGGTLFLDEIGDLSPATQAKLLRVIEDRSIVPLGGTQPIAVDVRLICATHRDLEAEVSRGRFREDLYFRLSAFVILVPPLRSRRAEIRAMAEHFAAEYARELGQPPPRLSSEVILLLETYPWPGNVRELRNAIERAIVLQPSGVILPEDLPERVREGSAPDPTGTGGADIDVRERLAEMERNAIVQALQGARGNRTHAARKLGISRRTLIYKMEKYGLKAKPRPGEDDAKD